MTTEESRIRHLRKWKRIYDNKQSLIELAMIRGFQSCDQIGIAFITIKKDRSGGYLINNKLWHELNDQESRILEDELKFLGASGPLGGYPSDHK